MGMLRWAGAVCMWVLAVTTAGAQTGAIVIEVQDPDGQPLPGAVVTISQDTGYLKTTAVRTDVQGRAEFPVLRAGGGYSIEVSFPGFSTLRQADLRVKINDTTTVILKMISGVEERVQVTASRDVIDLDQSERSTKFSDSFIADLPVPGRFYQNVLTMAPGVQDADGDGNPNVHGSRSRDFQTLVGGVSNVDPLTGQWMSRINPNSIEELEVIPAGAGVEFGRAQGGFARIVQKQGNNRHEGVFEFYYGTSKLDGDGANDHSTLPTADFETVQPMVQVSGPILRDKLWYRLSYERRDTEEPINVTTGVEIFERKTETRDAQLTWQVSARNKLALNYRSDPYETKNFGIDSSTPPESSRSQSREVDTWSLTWTAPYSPRVLVDSTVAWQDVNLSEQPSVEGVPNACMSGSREPFLRNAHCQDLTTDQTSGSWYRRWEDRRQRFTLKTQATVYAGRFLGARHELKTGISVENERYFRDLSHSASATLAIEGSEEGQAVFSNAFGIALVRLAVPENDESRATGNSLGLYIEDQLRPTQSLTVTLGARVDREEINSEGRQPLEPLEELEAFEELLSTTNPGQFVFFQDSFLGYEDFETFENEMKAQLCENEPPDLIGNCQVKVLQAITAQDQKSLTNRRRAENLKISNTNFSPYLALSWSPWANGKTAFKAAAGRHYNNIPLIVPLQELEPVLTDIEYRVNLTTFATQLNGSISPRINLTTVDHELRTPYQDELTLSFERELWAETSLGLTYVSRKYRDQFQDRNLNVALDDYGFCAFQLPGGNIYPVLPAPGGGVGSGVNVKNQWTGEVYADTDPGIGDGRIDDCTGTDLFIPVTNVVDLFGANTFHVQAPDGRQDLYLQNPFWGDILFIGNFNSTDYEAFVLEVVRRQYRGWEVNGSYTYSKAEGDGEDFFQELGNDPSLRETVSGFQSYDQRHVFKLNATTITPWGLRLGTAVSWQSGLPYSLLRQGIVFDAKPRTTHFYGGVGARTREDYYTGVRNDQRNDSYWNVDLRVAKEFDLGRGVHLQASAEVYNALNDGTYQVYNPFYEAGQQVNGTNESTRRFGRRWQLGMKVAF